MRCSKPCICDCLDFKQLRTVRDAVYQSPGGFEAVQYGYFYQRARESEKKSHESFTRSMALACTMGSLVFPSSWSLSA